MTAIDTPATGASDPGASGWGDHRPSTPGTDTTDVAPSRFRFGDVIAAGVHSMTRRGARSVLSALGVSIGIAALVAVLGLSESSRAQLSDELSRLGTNLLVVDAGTGFGSEDAALDVDASARIRNIGAVEEASAMTTTDAVILRNAWMSDNDTRGVTVTGADLAIFDTLNATVAEGTLPDDSWEQAPVAVIGSDAAARLGIDDVSSGPTVSVNGRLVTVVAVLDPLTLAESVDRSVVVSNSMAEQLTETDLTPTSIYVRTTDETVDAVRTLLPATVSPISPEEVEVSRPTDALSAQESADETFTSLFLGLGAVALLVGGIGIANVMIISVIERRSEIGLRRALGARRSHIRRQFLAEAVALGFAGGVAGVLMGSVSTVIFATTQEWRVVIPPLAAVVGLGGAVIIGALAGLYPAVRAARLSPTEALRGA